MTDSKKEVRIARGQRPGIVYLLPRTTRPDTRLEIDVALPEAAGLHRAERPPTVLEIPETGQLEETRCQNRPRGVDCARPGATHESGLEIAPLECTGLRSAPHTAATGVNSLLLLGINKESLMTWYKQRIVDDLV